MLERLVEDGETLELVGELRRLVDEPRRERGRGRRVGARRHSARARRSSSWATSTAIATCSPRSCGRGADRREPTAGRAETHASGSSAICRSGPGRHRRDRPRPAARAAERRRRFAACSAITRCSSSPSSASAPRRRVVPGESFHDLWQLNGGVDADLAGAHAGARLAGSRRCRPSRARETTLLVHADTPAYLALGGARSTRSHASPRAVLAPGRYDERRRPPRHRLRPHAARRPGGRRQALLDALRRLADRPRAHARSPRLLGVDPRERDPRRSSTATARRDERRPLPLRRRARLRHRGSPEERVVEERSAGVHAASSDGRCASGCLRSTQAMPRARVRASVRSRPSAHEPLVDRAHPAREGRVDGRSERDRLAVHRPARRDDEVGERDEAQGVDRSVRHERGTAKRRRGSSRAAPACAGARRHGRRGSDPSRSSTSAKSGLPWRW